MQSIDLLPVTHRSQVTVRSGKLWYLVLIAALGGGVAAVAIEQFLVRKELDANAAVVDLQYQAAQAEQLRLAGYQSELSQLDHQAALHTYLRHPWPASQLLRAVTSQAPDTIQLKELTIAHEALTESTGLRRLGASEALALSTAGEGESSFLVSADLETLANKYDQQRTVAHLRGQTRHVPSLHEYVSLLEADPLVEQVKISSLESHQDEAISFAIFQLQILFTPPHGHPDHLTPDDS